MNARNKLAALAAAVVLFLAAPAEASTFDRLTFGVKGGFNMANIRVETETTIRTNGTFNRFAWGGFVGYKLSDIVSLQLEVLDYPKGSEIPVTSQDSFYTEVLRYDYTEVPLLVKLTENTRSRFQPSLFAGPYIAFLKKAQAWVDGEEAETTEPITDQRKTDFGFTFGASFAYKLAGPLALIADARYDLGLINVDKTAGSKFNHRVISILVGVSL